MKKHLTLFLTVIFIFNTHFGSASQSTKSIMYVVLDYQGEIHASELQASVREKRIQTLLAPASYDRTQLVSFRADQIRHALEQKNALDDKPVNKSYYLVLDFQQLEKLEDTDASAGKGWKASVDGYLFKIDKNSNFRRLYRTSYPLTFIAMANLPVEVSRPVGKADSTEQLLRDLVQKSFDVNLDSLQKVLLHYVDRTPVSEVHPIRAKIGKREDLRTDDRYFAFSYVYNTKTFKTEKVFRGIVRATNAIADNLENPDSAGATKFYQTFGLKIQPGDMLQKKMNSGYELSVGRGYGSVKGWSGRLDLRLSRHIGIPALFLYFEAGMEKMVPVNTTYMLGPYSLYRYEAGLAKGFQMFRDLELRPYVGYGKESNILGYNSGYFSEYYKLGVNLSLTILPFLQVYGGYGYYQFSNIRDTYDNLDLGVPWSVCFPNRNGGNTLFGVRIAF